MAWSLLHVAVASSKDDSGKVVLTGLPPGFLDYEGRELRDQLDECLGRSMWYFTIGELPLSRKLGWQLQQI